MKISSTRIIVAVCAAMALSARAADAQVQRPQRAAARGLFGSATPSPNSQQQMDLSVSLFGAYDDDVTAGVNDIGSLAAGESGVYTGLTAGLSYERRLGRRVTFGASAGTSFRYIPDVRNQSVKSLGEQAGIGFSIGGEKETRNRLTVGASASYAPYYSLSLLPQLTPLDVAVGDVAPLPVDSVINRREAVGLGGGVTFERAIGARSTLVLNYSITQVRYTGDESRRQYSQGEGILFRRNISKNLGWKLGYQRNDSDFGVGTDKLANHIFDTGLDFLKPLSLTRRTTLSFSMGPSLYETNGTYQMRAVGDVALSHDMGRSWIARATYHRGVGMVPGLSSAVFSDAAGGSIEGLLTERLGVSGYAGYSSGEFALTGAANDFNTYQASAMLRAALARSLALYVQYVAYRYHFDSQRYLPLGLPDRLTRQGVRVGLTVWLPVLR